MNKKIVVILLSIFIVAVAAGTVLAAEAKTNTEIKMLSDKTLKNGDNIEFELKDAQGNAIASQKVKISFEANGKYENYTVNTDKDGKFFLVLYNEALGDHKVIVNYTGSDKYNPCKLEETINIVEGTSTAEKTESNSTASTVKYDNATQGNASGTNDTNNDSDDVLYYDEDLNVVYNKYGIVVGGQSDGMHVIDVIEGGIAQEVYGDGQNMV